MQSKLVWIDLEMTGLNPEKENILEIATVVTDNNLNIIAEGPHFVVNQPEDLLKNMDDWNKTHHTKSGLLEKVRSSTVTLKYAEEETLLFLKKHCKALQAPLCGNSVSLDKEFLFRYMPHIYNFLHYRIIDVSTVKELVKRWYPESNYKEFKKVNIHRALEDIYESIEELKHYRHYFFLH